MEHAPLTADWWGVPYAVGSAIILLVALVIGVIGRHLKETKPEKRREDAAADELIVRNAEAAGWGPPRTGHHHKSSLD